MRDNLASDIDCFLKVNESLFDDFEVLCTANQIVACANDRTCLDQPVQITSNHLKWVTSHAVPYVIYGTHPWPLPIYYINESCMYIIRHSQPAI